ncbi:NAD(P)-dependent oxidoreductase [Sinisalibacter aestuarii]|uniref:Dihydrofolate reductase n=1 Tax=Sinisalibacter aestuarii TaxID=2949426 RepID=A0ABQ5LPW9_9RHOB|nr:NAD(P)-dependent oxidoreductase [Sinisalibacter aestuarii]GKY87050.1 dihydrofolate reductase [Sinisalibacter aestuarii]
MLIVAHFQSAATDALRAHPSRPTVVEILDAPRWVLPPDTAMLLTTPPGWEAAPALRPEDWPSGLRLVQSVSVGVDAYPRWLVEGQVFATARGTNAPSIAEYVFAAIFARHRSFAGLTIRRAEDWGHIEFGSLEGKTLGLAGFGSIGRAVAPVAQALGMRVAVFRKTGAPAREPGIETADSLAHLFAMSDILVLAMPATPETHRIVNREVLGHAKPGLHLINVARGALVDQDDLQQALDAGQIGFATLDVTDPEPLPAGHPLYTHPSVALTPHIAWAGPGNERRFAELALHNLGALLGGGQTANAHDVRSGR